MFQAGKTRADIYDMAPDEHHDGGDVPLPRMSEALRSMMRSGVARAVYMYRGRIGALDETAREPASMPLMVLHYVRMKSIYRLWIEDSVGRGGQGDVSIEAAEIEAEQRRSEAESAESEARALRQLARELPASQGLEGQERMDAIERSRQATEAADIAQARAVALRLVADEATRKARVECLPSDQVFGMLLLRAIYNYAEQTRIGRGDIEAALGLAPSAARTPTGEIGGE